MTRTPSWASAISTRLFSTRSAVRFWVREKMTVSAVLTWSRKNSPKFFMCMRHLPASTMVAQPEISISGCAALHFSTAFTISLSLPTPLGSMIRRSGLYFSISSSTAFWKSPTRVQQMQPEFSSSTMTPLSLRKEPSTPTSPYSFSSRMIFSPFIASLPSSFLIRVVLPAPRKPEIMLILTMFISPFRYVGRLAEQITRQISL